MQFPSNRRSGLAAPRRLFDAQAGAAIAEAALALPILFLLIFGIFGFGLVMSSYQSTVDAAREGARYGTAPIPPGYALPTAAQIAQKTCNYLRTGVYGGNSSCNKYVSGTTAPPNLASCTDSTFNAATAAEDIYVAVAPVSANESYSVTGPGGTTTLAQTQVVVGIRKKIKVPVLGYTLNLRTCSSMRSENN